LVNGKAQVKIIEDTQIKMIGQWRFAHGF
jgi:hypothetical protein